MTGRDFMDAAYNELMRAADRFMTEGDTVRERYARTLAAKVAADDPYLLMRMWRALPHGDEPGARPDDAFAGLAVDWRVRAEALELLRERRFVRQTGGWWRALGDEAPR